MDTHVDKVDKTELFSSDDEFQSKTACSCIPSSVKAIGSCLIGDHHQLVEDTPDDFKKPTGLFGEKTFKQICLETQKKSPYGKNKNFGLISVIVKSPDNLT
jgi:hypothetical protein